MADQEAMVGTKTDENIPQDKVGELTKEAQQGDEVGGRAIVTRLARCSNCGLVGYINYDTINYRAYRCSNCSAILIF